ncbi:hypothetical protein PoB_002012600 [Plakobranchus ocellatus]|uniref:Uncharacterized protein n=1 Tax=Plakobranchus ocellatus TaxID=259542 RepID=A0AAV3Z2S5_9GAST|nr:hypothetical protein PoB_002012600 [Plakobranchus ocellatus]
MDISIPKIEIFIAREAVPPVKDLSFRSQHLVFILQSLNVLCLAVKTISLLPHLLCGADKTLQAATARYTESRMKGKHPQSLRHTGLSAAVVSWGQSRATLTGQQRL